MNVKKTQTTFLIVLLLIAIILAYFVFRPFLNSLVLAAAFAIIFHPVYKKILPFFGNHKSMASLATLVLFSLLVIAPLTFFVSQIFQQSLQLYEKLASTRAAGGTFADVFTAIETNLKTFIPNIEIDLSLYVQQGVNFMVQNLSVVFSTLASVIFSLFITMLAFYYFLKDGEKVEKISVKLSPLPDKYDYAIFDKLTKAVNSVVKGTLTIAFIQGILVGTGFAIFGVPNAALWGSFGVMSALVPTVGTSLVMFPAVLYLLIIGNYTQAFGLAIWGVLAVGLIDNFLSPKLIERGISLHPLLILLSVLGGLSFFGPIGFIMGPLILSFLFALVDIYHEEFKKILDHNS